MLEYFAYQYGDTLWDAPLGTPLHDIRHILSPADPLYKLENFSKYSGDKTSPEFDAMQRAIVDYAKYFLWQDPSSAVKDTNDLAFDEEYLALCNYIYMKKADLRRKLQDMLNNMNDMNEMGPDYIEKRQIKWYILLVLLNNNWMHEEVTELKSKFQSLWHPMFSPAEILDRIEKKLSKRKKLS